MNSESILSVQNLHVNYGGIRALRGVSLDVNEGEIITLVGANGAGKSTLMNSIMGLVSKASGSIHYKGEDITTTETAKIVKKGIVLSPEGRHIFPAFTVRDNLMMGGYFSSTREKAETVQTVFQLFPILKDRYNQMGGTLSGGEQQMLAIGRALMARPKIMMLDEPSLGLPAIAVPPARYTQRNRSLSYRPSGCGRRENCPFLFLHSRVLPHTSPDARKSPAADDGSRLPRPAL